MASGKRLLAAVALAVALLAPSAVRAKGGSSACVPGGHWEYLPDGEASKPGDLVQFGSAARLRFVGPNRACAARALLIMARPSCSVILKRQPDSVAEFKILLTEAITLARRAGERCPMASQVPIDELRPGGEASFSGPVVTAGRTIWLTAGRKLFYVSSQRPTRPPVVAPIDDHPAPPPPLACMTRTKAAGSWRLDALMAAFRIDFADGAGDCGITPIFMLSDGQKVPLSEAAWPRYRVLGGHPGLQESIDTSRVRPVWLIEPVIDPEDRMPDLSRLTIGQARRLLLDSGHPPVVLSGDSFVSGDGLDDRPTASQNPRADEPFDPRTPPLLVAAQPDTAKAPDSVLGDIDPATVAIGVAGGVGAAGAIGALGGRRRRLGSGSASGQGEGGTAGNGARSTIDAVGGTRRSILVCGVPDFGA